MNFTPALRPPLRGQEHHTGKSKSLINPLWAAVIVGPGAKKDRFWNANIRIRERAFDALRPDFDGVLIVRVACCDQFTGFDSITYLLGNVDAGFGIDARIRSGAAHAHTVGGKADFESIDRLNHHHARREFPG